MGHSRESPSLTLQGRVQVASTVFLTELGASHTEQLKLCLPIIVPVLSGATADSKLQVKVRHLITLLVSFWPTIMTTCFFCSVCAELGQECPRQL